MSAVLDRPTADDVLRRLATATRKADELTRRRATLEARLEEARRTYRRLADAAKEKFGTENLDELRAKLAAMEEDNARKVAAFEENLRQVEQQIVQTEALLGSGA
ncbi:MAG: hypothetical protein PHO55_13950 [Thiomonas arsenitoxydans]|jgi:predicted transcriptional regulator|nr:hypothetical protein [Thiomonas arsenitoxydans]